MRERGGAQVVADRRVAWGEFPEPPAATRAATPAPLLLVIAVLPALITLLEVGRLAALGSGALGLLGANVAGRAGQRATTNVMAGMSATAAILGWRSSGAAVTLVLQGAAILIGWVDANGAGAARTVSEALARAARGLGRTIAGLGVGLLAVPLVLLPWCVQRLSRWDPTWTRRPADSRFVPRHAADGDSRRSWSPDPSDLRPGPGRGIHQAAVLFLAVGLAIGLVYTAKAAVARLQDRPDVGTAAMASSPWWPDARVAQFEIFDNARWSAYVGPVASDTAHPYVNVENGRRRTWQPPAGPGTPPLRVWMFGGSAAFGVGQRDEHTIASELARASWADRLAVDVVNFGFHGDVHWMEQARLVHELARGEPPPDLVVFYDGFNELPAVGAANERGKAAGSPFVGTLDTLGLSRAPSPLRWLDRVIKGDPTTSTPTVVMPRADVEQAAARQYRDSVEQTLRWLEGRGVTGRFFYQPSAASLPTAMTLDVPVTEEDRAATARFRAVLPPEVIDLAGVFDDLDQPVYLDGVHTNELGARVVAHAMYENLRGDLAAAAP